VQVTTAEMALFMQRIADLGYAIVSREDNWLCPWCSEFTFLRVHCS
jgi:hypothetical protein